MDLPDPKKRSKILFSFDFGIVGELSILVPYVHVHVHAIIKILLN